MRLGFLLILPMVCSGLCRATGPFAECIPEPGSPASAVVDWMRASGQAVGAPLRTPEAGDVPTEFGAVATGSCFQGLAPGLQARRLRRLKTALSMAITQAGRCFGAAPFPDLTNVVPVLRNSFIHCAPLPSANGNTKTTVDHGWCPSRKLLGTLVTTSNFDKSYAITVNSGAGSVLESGDLTELAKTLLHEALHHTSSNTSWHNSANADRSVDFCTRSMFADRVHLLSGACFGAAEVGQDYYGGGAGAACDSACRYALTQVDPELRSSYSGIYGAQTVIAAPYASAEVARRCGELHARGERWREARRYNAVTDTAVLGLLSRVPPTLGPTGIMAKLVELQTVSPFSARSTGAASRDQRKARVDRIETEVRAILSGACAGTVPLERREFCVDFPARFGGAITRLRTHLDSLEPADFDLLARAPNVE